MPGYKKNLPVEELSSLYEKAVARAVALDTWQRQQGEGRKDANPSTGVHKLTETIREFDGV
jgi:hypothetical protein